MLPRSPDDGSHDLGVDCLSFDNMMGHAVSTAKAMYIVNAVEVVVYQFEDLGWQNS
jgi:hypothetical protein